MRPWTRQTVLRRLCRIVLGDELVQDLGRFMQMVEVRRSELPQYAVTGRRPPVSLDRHQQLVLDLGQACRPGLILAPALELAQGNPELQQPFEVTPGQRHRGSRGK